MRIVAADRRTARTARGGPAALRVLWLVGSLLALSTQVDAARHRPSTDAQRQEQGDLRILAGALVAAIEEDWKGKRIPQFPGNILDTNVYISDALRSHLPRAFLAKTSFLKLDESKGEARLQRALAHVVPPATIRHAGPGAPPSGWIARSPLDARAALGEAVHVLFDMMTWISENFDLITTRYMVSRSWDLTQTLESLTLRSVQSYEWASSMSNRVRFTLKDGATLTNSASHLYSAEDGLTDGNLIGPLVVRYARAGGGRGSTSRGTDKTQKKSKNEQKKKKADDEEAARRAEADRKRKKSKNEQTETKKKKKADDEEAARRAEADRKRAEMERFLSREGLGAFYRRLADHEVDSIEDLRLLEDDDLREAGIAKSFQRRKILKAIRKLDAGGRGGGDGKTVTLAEILRLMESGDARMEEDDCETARLSYAEAKALAGRGRFSDVSMIIEWKLFKAESCLGAAVLPLPGPEVEDPTCGIKALGDEELLADFSVAAQPGAFRRVRHWDRWFGLFKLDESSCSAQALKRAYRKVMLRYHPDKFRGSAHCAQTMSLIVNAGKELLENHSACQGKGEL
eukprot:g1940.t1